MRLYSCRRCGPFVVVYGSVPGSGLESRTNSCSHTRAYVGPGTRGQHGRNEKPPGHINCGQAVFGYSLQGCWVATRRPLGAMGDARCGRRKAKTLAVVVHFVFLRSRAQANRLDLVFVLEVDVGLDKILGEDIALEQELVVVL